MRTLSIYKPNTQILTTPFCLILSREFKVLESEFPPQAANTTATKAVKTLRSIFFIHFLSLKISFKLLQKYIIIAKLIILKIINNAFETN